MRAFLLSFCLAAGLACPAASLARQAAVPPAGASPSEVRYGVGLRARGLFVPRAAFEYFAEVVPSGIARPAVGLVGIRRKGAFEASLALAWAGLSPKKGIWLDDPDHNPSLVEFDGFSWISLDVAGVWLHPFNEYLALRYGMGVGVGFLLGDVLETDYECPGGRYRLDACRQSPTAKDVRQRVELPPLVPVVNAVLGLQYAPAPQVAFNLDGGLQSALFIGLDVVFFLR